VVAPLNNATHTRSEKADTKSVRNELRHTLICSTWRGRAFTRSRYLTDFQENNKSNSCLVAISNTAIYK